MPLGQDHVGGGSKGPAFGPSGHECEQRLGLLATFEDSMTFAPYEANEPCSTLSYCTLISGLLPCTGIDRGHGNL